MRAPNVPPRPSRSRTPPCVFVALLPPAGRAASGSAPNVGSVGKYSTPDNIYEENRLAPGGAADKRAFTYFMLGGARFLYASAARLAVINIVGTLSASADVLALAAVEVDLAAVAPGSTVTVKWRGKPVFIKHRTEAQIADVASTNISELRHPQTDLERVKNPEWCVHTHTRVVQRGAVRAVPRECVATPFTC